MTNEHNYLVTTDLVHQPQSFKVRREAYGEALERAMHHMPHRCVSVQSTLRTHTVVLELSDDRTTVRVYSCEKCRAGVCAEHPPLYSSKERM